MLIVITAEALKKVIVVLPLHLAKVKESLVSFGYPNFAIVERRTVT